MTLRFLAMAATAALISGNAAAVPFDFIRIGDVDGFGWSTATGGPGTAGLLRDGGIGPADTDGDGLLEQTEFLPDGGNTNSPNGTVATGSGDDWDNRSAAEFAGTAAATGNGFTLNSAAVGADWTDFTLSTSAPDAWFPDGDNARPNEPVFEFEFFVATGDIVNGSTLFFNLIFGDYDVFPAAIDLIFTDTTKNHTVGLSTRGGGNDGLIQAATTILDFDEVFTATTGGYDGCLKVFFDAPKEPYTTFDFVELSLDQIPFEPVPEPATLAIFGLGLAGLGLARRRRKG